MFEDDRLATEAEADREYAHNAGMDRPEQPWILSDRDVWYANPFYQGPKARHPEDDQEWDDDRDIEAGQFREAYEAAHPAYPFMGWDHLTLADDDAGMPF